MPNLSNPENEETTQETLFKEFYPLQDPLNRTRTQIKREAERLVRKDLDSGQYFCTFEGCENNRGIGWQHKCRARSHVEDVHFNITWKCPVLSCQHKIRRQDNINSHTKNVHGLLAENVSKEPVCYRFTYDDGKKELLENIVN